jgi:hypothetical protein
MRVRISEPELLGELVDFLHGRVELVVEELADDEIDAGLVGSYRLEAQELAMELHLRAWRASHPGVGVEIVPEAGPEAD